MVERQRAIAAAKNSVSLSAGPVHDSICQRKSSVTVPLPCEKFATTVTTAA